MISPSACDSSEDGAYSGQDLLDAIFSPPRPTPRAQRLYRLPCPVLQAISDRSPTPLALIPQEPEFYLPNGPYEDLICIGHDVYTMTTLSRSELQALYPFAFVVPAPMTARNGWTVSGEKLTSRANSNTGPIYATVFSATGLDVLKQSEAITALEAYGKPAFIVAVNDEYLEAWFPISALKISLPRFHEIARQLGAASTIKTRCHPYHLPGGFNSATGKAHAVIYLDEPRLELMRADARLTPYARKRLIKSGKLYGGKQGGKQGALTKSQKS